MVLDGEVVSDDFQALMKQIHRKNSIQNKDAKLFLFDYLPLVDFQKGIYEKSYNSRIKKLKEIYDEIFFKKVKLINIIESVNVDLDTELGMKNLKDLIKIL